MTKIPRLFRYGFLVSVGLLSVCAYYGVSPGYRPSLFFFLSTAEGALWHISMPWPFVHAGFLFILLNFPPYMIMYGALKLIDSTARIPPGPRAVLVLALCLVLSTFWWWSLGRLYVWVRQLWPFAFRRRPRSR